MTGSMSWESPPPASHGFNWVEIAAALRAKPSEWLKVYDDGPTSIANAIRQASITALTPIIRAGSSGGFEVRTRNNKPGPPRQCTLYLRWVPPTGGV